MEEEKYMRRCIQLAQNGLCNAAPNPMVGAVIVCDGKIIGEGYHVRCGKAHAEVNAIRSVKETSLLKHSTIYVSLEPCSHHGKTPPCADLIIENKSPVSSSAARTLFQGCRTGHTEAERCRTRSNRRSTGRRMSTPNQKIHNLSHLAPPIYHAEMGRIRRRVY